MTKKRQRLRRILTRLEPKPPRVEPVKERVITVEKIIEKPVEKIVEKVVEKRVKDASLPLLASLVKKVKSLGAKQEKTASVLSRRIEALDVSEELKELNERISSLPEQKETDLSGIREELETQRRELLSKIANQGGGNANRQILANSSILSERYTDINFIGAITASDDNTNKRVDVNLTAVGGVDSVSNTDGTLDVSPTTGNVVASRASIVGDVSVPGGSNTATLATVNSNVGTFGSSTQVGQFTVNGKGLVTAASVVGISFPAVPAGVTSVLGGTAITVDNTIPSTPIVNLGTASVAAATYGTDTTVPRITVDAQGRVQAASTVGITFPTVPAGVTSVLAGTGITVDNATPSTPIVNLGTSSVAAAQYGSETTVGQFTVDAQGRLSQASTIGITFPAATTPGGANSNIQFNDGGSFGGSSVLTFNKNSSVMTMPTASLTGSFSASGVVSGSVFSGMGTSITGLPAANILAGTFGTGAYVMDTNLQVPTLKLGPTSTGVVPGFFVKDLAANFAIFGAYPQSGTNVNMSMQVFPKGTGQANNRAQISVFNTDGVADTTNIEFLTFRATGTQFTLASGIGGTGTLRPLVLSAGAASSSPTNTSQLVLTTGGNTKIAGTAVRATTEGTNHLDIFNGTAPAGTLANGISLYSSGGEAFVMDAGGVATQFSPHDKEGYWHFNSENTRTGKRVVIDVEKMLRFLNDKFGTDFIHEFVTNS